MNNSQFFSRNVLLRLQCLTDLLNSCTRLGYYILCEVKGENEKQIRLTQCAIVFSFFDGTICFLTYPTVKHQYRGLGLKYHPKVPNFCPHNTKRQAKNQLVLF